MKRIQQEFILKDLEKKMVFLVGPRQVGKTWLAREIAQNFKHPLYLNYDNRADREVIIHERWLPTTDLLVLDEIHKMAGWQNFLKGIYDTKSSGMRMLITGSSRMDLLASSGESLAGRYYRHRLLPLSLREIKEEQGDTALLRLLERGGFPEPFLTESNIDVQRWRNQYVDGMIRYDILDIQRIADFKVLGLTLQLLRSRVGSPISFSSIARDIGASTATIIKYIHLLESLFLVFRVTPYAQNIARSLLKEPKIYFYDNGLVDGDAGARFENMVALSLLKDTWGREDYLGESRELHYLRTKDGVETDFAVTKNSHIEYILECKTGDVRPDKNIRYFAGKYGLKGIQLVQNLRTDQLNSGIEIRSAEGWLEGLFL